MLRRNPSRRYMVNAPIYAMEEILKKSLPAGSVFIGTREFPQEPEKKPSFWRFLSCKVPCGGEPPIPQDLSLVCSTKESLIFYDKDNPQHPWLTISCDEPSAYQWITRYPYCPLVSTRYVVTDLTALADSRPVAPF